MPGGYGKNSPPPQNFDQIAHFIVEVRLITDGLCDRGPEELTVALPQPVYGDLDRAGAHAQPGCDFLSGQLVFSGETAL